MKNNFTRSFLLFALPLLTATDSYGMDHRPNQSYGRPVKIRERGQPPQELTYKAGWNEEWNIPKYNDPKNYFTLLPQNHSQITPEFLCTYLNGLQSYFGSTKFNQISYSRSLYDIAKLKNDNKNSHVFLWFKSYLNQNPEWLKEWYLCSKGKLADFNAQAFSNSLYAHALLGIQPDPQWLKEWYRNSKGKLADFDAQHFSNSLNAHALLGIQPDPEWLKEWYRNSKGKLADFNAQEFSNSLYAHALLGIQPDPEWLKEWYRNSKGKLVDFNAQEFSNSLYAHTLLGIQPDPEWLKEWYRNSKGKLVDFNAQDFSNSLYAHAPLGIQPDPQWLKEWYLCSKGKLADFKAQAFSNSLYAHALLGIQPDPEWLKEWYRNSKGKLAGFNAQEFSNSLYAHALLGIQPDPQWLKEWYLCSKGKLVDFNAQEFSNSLYAHTLLGIQPDPQWLKEWYRNSKGKLVDFNAQDFSNSLYAHALLGIQPDPQWLEVSQHSMYQQVFSIEGYSQLFMANQWYQAATKHSLIDFSKIQLSFKIENMENIRNQNLIISQLEKNVVEILKLSPYRIDCQKWVPEILSHVDIFLPTLNLVIQVDGPSHFLKDGSYDFQTNFQTNALKYFGYNLVRIPYKEWGLLKSKEDKISYLQEATCLSPKN